MSPVNQLKFEYLGLHVQNIDTSVSFFAKTLDLPVVGRAREPLPEFDSGADRAERNTVMLRLPNTQSALKIIENPDAERVDTCQANPGTCHVAFYTDNMEDTWAVAEAAGAELISTDLVLIEGGPFDGGKAIYCIEPTGYRVEFMCGKAYLDGTPRDPDKFPKNMKANELTHFGIHVRDRDQSLKFYRDLLGTDQVAAWLEATPTTRRVINMPTAELNMAILRIPGTSKGCMEIIEYRGVPKTPVDTRLTNNGVAHLCYSVSDLAALRQKLKDGGITILQDGDRELWCEDPDGYRVRFLERAN